jgi:hypothetical protein
MRTGPEANENPSDPESGYSPKEKYYKPWYSSRYQNIADVASYWQSNYANLKSRTERFTETFYHSTLPPRGH